MRLRGEGKTVIYALAGGEILGFVAVADTLKPMAPEAVRAHPTEEHFLPLFVALGAAGPGARAEQVFDGFEGAALAMDAYRFRQQPTD